MPIKFVGKGLSERYKRMAKELPDTVRQTLLEAGELVKADFEKTTDGWSNEPDFSIEVKRNAITVITDSEIYKFVDRGTRPHKIPVGDKGFLAFRGKYQAKTTPRIIGTRPGGAYGPYVFTAKTIDHPGTKAREFTSTIYSKWDKKIAKIVRDAIKNGVEAVGV